jgi:hypothetical protein
MPVIALTEPQAWGLIGLALLALVAQFLLAASALNRTRKDGR